MAILDSSVVEAFRRDGAVKLTGVFSPEWIAALRDGVARNMAEPGTYAKGYTAEGKPGAFFGDYCNWRRIPEYEDFLKNSPAPDLAGALTGSDTVVLFHEHVLVKEPATEERTPWHHDQPYYCVEGTQTCSLWIPLDPVPRETCVEFVAGSHAWGKRFMPTKFRGEAYDRADEELEPLPDIEAARDDYSILGWDMEPGDAKTGHSKMFREGDVDRLWKTGTPNFFARKFPTTPKMDAALNERIKAAKATEN